MGHKTKAESFAEASPAPLPTFSLQQMQQRGLHSCPNLPSPPLPMKVVIGQFNELNPIGECDQWIPTFDNPEPGPAPEGCASRGTPFCLEGGECDVGNDTVPLMATVLPAWQASNAVFRVGVGTGESDRKDAITVYKNGTVFIGDLRTPGPGRRLSASDGALEKKLEATEKKLAALEASYTKELAALKAAVAALTRNP